MSKSEKYFLDKLPEVYQAEVLDNISYLILAHTFNPISSIDIVERYGALIKDINELYLEKYCEYDLSVRDRCITIFIVHHILSNLDYWCVYPQFSKLEYEYTKPIKQHYVIIDKKEINKCIMKYKNYIFNTMLLMVSSLCKGCMSDPASVILYNSDIIEGSLHIRQFNTEEYNYKDILYSLLSSLIRKNDSYRLNLLKGGGKL
jgi:hypothetical protein